MAENTVFIRYQVTDISPLAFVECQMLRLIPKLQLVRPILFRSQVSMFIQELIGDDFLIRSDRVIGEYRELWLYRPAQEQNKPKVEIKPTHPFRRSLEDFDTGKVERRIENRIRRRSQEHEVRRIYGAYA